MRKQANVATLAVIALPLPVAVASCTVTALAIGCFNRDYQCHWQRQQPSSRRPSSLPLAVNTQDVTQAASGRQCALATWPDSETSSRSRVVGVLREVELASLTVPVSVGDCGATRMAAKARASSDSETSHECLANLN